MFQQRKLKILKELAVPDSEYNDLSPKGTIDAGIRSLVDEINAVEDLVTTSSCAGRIAVYEAPTAQRQVKEHQDNAEDGQEQHKTGLKGGGRWLFVSHEPMSDVDGASTQDLLKDLDLVPDSLIETTYEPTDRPIHLRFEPMILHVLCSSMISAKKVLGAAMSAGFRESGISSVNEQQDLILTAVRTNGLTFDSIIAVRKPDETIQLAVSPEHIRMLVSLANSRFEVNKSRISRFRNALLVDSTASRSKGTAAWEPAEERKVRLRAEGLRRQQELRQSTKAEMSAETVQ